MISKIKKIFFIFLVASFGILCKQSSIKPKNEKKDSYTCAIKINDYKNAPLLLFDFYGYESKRIDSINTNQNGEAIFTFKKDNYKGFYRIIPLKSYLKDANTVIDIIFNDEDIEIEVSLKDINNTIKVNQSYENIIYYDYLKKSNDYIAKEKVLLAFLSLYPKTDVWYQKTENYFNEIIIEYDAFLANLAAEHSTSMAYKFIKAKQPVAIPKNLAEDLYKSYMKAHFFDNINFNDSILMRYSIFTDLISEYFKLYELHDSLKPYQSKEYRKFVDVIYTKSKDQAKQRQNFMEFLIDGFEAMSLDSMVFYVYDNYLNIEICENTNNLLVFSKRVEGLKNTAVGKSMNDIVINDMLSGRTFKISAIDAENTLVLFWSTKCKHCIKLFQQLQDFYASINQEHAFTNKKLEVLAIALDTIDKDYRDFINMNESQWKNVCDLKGFNGTYANKYGIYATPSMFLLNKQKQIILKPRNFEALVLFFNHNKEAKL